MSHMVIYRSVDGKPGFQQTDDLVSAVEFVERLRNVEGVESARIYRLEQVNFRFQPYYQVHLDNAEAPSAPPLNIAPAVEAAPPSVVAPVTQVAPAATAAPLVSAPAATAEAAPTPPPVPTAAMAAAAAAEPAPSTPDSTDAGAPTLGATPAPEPAEGNGIRRGLFGR